MKYFDKLGRNRMEIERRIAERRTGAPLNDTQQSIARVGKTVPSGIPNFLRDEIAMTAMAALIAQHDGVMFPETISQHAYRYADAMMAERVKQDGEE